MKILTFSAYFTPERAAGIQLTEDLLEGFAAAGHEADVYVPTPTRGVDAETINAYRKIREEEKYDGRVRIHRFRMMQEGKNPVQRALRYIVLNLAFVWKGLRCPADVMFIDSTPPTQGVMAAIIKKLKKIPMIYNLHDIFPDSMVTTGLTRKGSLVWKIGRIMENITYKNADKIITVSHAMKRNIMEKGVPEEKIVVVSNWIDTNLVKPVEKENNSLFEEFGIDREQFTVVYAGNLGAAQGAGVILDAARLLPEVQFVIFGGGAEYESVKARSADLPNVIINRLLPQSRVSEVYSLGDVCLVTCKKGVGTSGMPSKTWSIMACNRPIVAAFDTNAELAEILHEAKAGIAVEPENAALLAQAIRGSMHNNSEMCGGREYVCDHASKQSCVTKYVQTIQETILKDKVQSYW